jgi:hypothetical protein
LQDFRFRVAQRERMLGQLLRETICRGQVHACRRTL